MTNRQLFKRISLSLSLSLSKTTFFLSFLFRPFTCILLDFCQYMFQYKYTSTRYNLFGTSNTINHFNYNPHDDMYFILFDYNIIILATNTFDTSHAPRKRSLTHLQKVSTHVSLRSLRRLT